jgi:hypothetical protein
MNKSLDVSLTFTNNNYLNNKKISNNLIKNRILSNLKKAENILSYDKFKDLQNDLILNLKDNKTIVANIVNNNYKLEIIGGDPTTINSKPYIKSRNNSPQPNRPTPVVAESKNKPYKNPSNYIGEFIDNLESKIQPPITNAKLNKSNKSNSTLNKTSQPNTSSTNKKMETELIKPNFKNSTPSETSVPTDETESVISQSKEPVTTTTENPTTQLSNSSETKFDQPRMDLESTQTSVPTEETPIISEEPKKDLTTTTSSEYKLDKPIIGLSETSVPTDETPTIIDEPKEPLTTTTESSTPRIINPAETNPELPQRNMEEKEKKQETFLNQLYKFIAGPQKPHEGGFELNYLSDNDDDDFSASNTLDTHTYFVGNNEDSDEEETLSDKMRDIMYLNSLNVKKLREISKENNVQLTNNGTYLKKNDLIKQIQNKLANP